MLQITPGEQRALQLLAKGRAIDDVAVALDVSPAVFESYLSALFARMGVSGTAEAVKDAFRRGLLLVDEKSAQPGGHETAERGRTQ